MRVATKSGRRKPSATLQSLARSNTPNKLSRCLILLAVLLLTSCTEPPTIEIHEPGVYKGKADPLLNRSGTPELEAKLRERLTQVQTDR